MQLDAGAATVVLLVINLGATGARELHRWVSSREYDSVTLDGLRRMIEEANERASERNSEIQRKMLGFEANMIEIQTILGLSGRGKHNGMGV